MTQFSRDKTTHVNQDAERSLFSRIGEIFSKRRETQSLQDPQQNSTNGCSLPGLTSDDYLLEPLLAQFLSSQGDPTLLSIRRANELPEGISDRVEFCAVHNHGADRHILSYVLVTYDTGQKLLHGYAREVGSGPLVSGSYAPEECPRLISFELSSHGAGGNPTILARSAFRLAEVFSERGTWGADEYLQEVARAIGSSSSFVQRTTRFEQLLTDGAHSGVETDHCDGGKTARTFLSDEQVHTLDKVQGALLAIDDLSHEVFLSVREVPEFSLSEEVDDDSLKQVRFRTVALHFSFLSLRMWAHAHSPDGSPDDGVIFAIRLPRIWFSPSADMSGLTLRVAGPQNRFGMREWYSVIDTENVLAIGDFSRNDEFLRNLFLTLHRINSIPDRAHRQVEPLLDVLSHYGLHARPASLLAALTALRKSFLNWQPGPHIS